MEFLKGISVVQHGKVETIRDAAKGSTRQSDRSNRAEHTDNLFLYESPDAEYFCTGHLSISPTLYDCE